MYKIEKKIKLILLYTMTCKRNASSDSSLEGLQSLGLPFFIVITGNNRGSKDKVVAVIPSIKIRICSRKYYRISDITIIL